MTEKSLLLSALVIVGPRRKRSQRVLDALYLQTAVDSMEIVILDFIPDSVPRLETSPTIRTLYFILPETESWTRAKAEGVRRAKAPIVAFIEDHSIPAPDWAETLIEAHKGPWAAVGYAFTNANPETYVSRAGFIADYGIWAHPVRRGPTHLLPGNNVSYKRDLLLSFGEGLETVLAADFNIHETLSKQGLPMFLESRAFAAHENYTCMSDLLRANHSYSHLLGAKRVRAQSWGRLWRMVYSLGAPLGVPAIRLARLLRSLRSRRSLWPTFVTVLPIILLVYFWSAVGESLGYLFGPGNTEWDFKHWELATERAPEE